MGRTSNCLFEGYEIWRMNMCDVRHEKNTLTGRLHKIQELEPGKSKPVWITQWMVEAKEYIIELRNISKMRLKRQMLYYFYSEISLYCKADSQILLSFLQNLITIIHCLYNNVCLMACLSMLSRNISSAIVVQ